MHSKVIFQFFRTCIDDTSAGVVAQFSDSIKAGGIFSKDGEYSYTANLSRVSVPILFMVGGSDGFVSEEMIRDTYDAVSSEDKELFIFSKAHGYSTDYGHCDLLLGKNSQQEVYPVMLNWLNNQVGL